MCSFNSAVPEIKQWEEAGVGHARLVRVQLSESPREDTGDASGNSWDYQDAPETWNTHVTGHWLLVSGRWLIHFNAMFSDFSNRKITIGKNWNRQVSEIDRSV